MFPFKKRPIKKGDTVRLVHSFNVGNYSFQKGDICTITYAGLFDVDIELKGNPNVWATDLSYNDVEKIE